MERLHKHGDLIIQNVKEGDIIEITEGVFLRIKKINLVTEENLAGTKKTNVYLKGEVISNERRIKRIKQERDSR